MMRNLRERVEVLAPVLDPALRKRLMHALAVYWADNMGTHWMRHDGGYEKARPEPGDKSVNAQEYFARLAAGDTKLPDIPGLWET
jgi:polyphosphate kinase